MHAEFDMSSGGGEGRINHSLKEEIRAYWSARAATFDESTGHRIEDARESPHWQSLFTRALGPLAGRAVLDLACGTGEISRVLLGLGAQVTGVDFAEPMLDRARKKHAGRPFEARLADVETLMLEPDNHYDALITRHLVWTLADPHAAFSTWLRVLKPGGRLLVVDGDFVAPPLHRRALRKIADTIAPPQTPGSLHPGAVDRATHQHILRQVHYSQGLRPEHLMADLARAGFEAPRRHSVAAIYWWGMRHAPLADRLRLVSVSRFALSVSKPLNGRGSAGGFVPSGNR